MEPDRPDFDLVPQLPSCVMLSSDLDFLSLGLSVMGLTTQTLQDCCVDEVSVYTT